MDAAVHPWAGTTTAAPLPDTVGATAAAIAEGDIVAARLRWAGTETGVRLPGMVEVTAIAEVMVIAAGAAEDTGVAIGEVPRHWRGNEEEEEAIVAGDMVATGRGGGRAAAVPIGGGAGTDERMACRVCVP